MKTARLLLGFLSLSLLSGVMHRAAAQMPTDNDTWKKRCEVLRDADPNARGTVPDWLAKAPGTAVPGPRFTTFGWDRARAGQHYVACTFFYLGAIADHNHSNKHADRVHAHESAVMGRLEDKAARHEPGTSREGLTAARAKAAEIPKPALTVPEEEGIVQAATTMPLEPPSAESTAQSGKPSPAVPRKKKSAHS